MKTTRTISLTKELDDALVAIAAREQRTVSSLVTFYLRNAVSRHNTEKFNALAQDNLREARRRKRAAKSEAPKA